MRGSPGRKLRRRMEAAMITASRPAIRAAAAQQLKNDAEKFASAQRVAAAAAALESGRHEQVDPKQKRVRTGPRDA